MGDTMSEWIKLERLPGNDLSTPKYETEQSAGFDFAACLTRPCKLVLPTEKIPFTVNDEGDRTTISGIESWRPKTQPEADRLLGVPKNKPLLIIEPQEVIMVPLGYKSEFGERYVLQIHVRSSVGVGGLMLANGTGIVDPDYRGELFAVLWNRSNTIIPIKHGQRIVQGVLIQFTWAIIDEVPKVHKTRRGEGGFGSTDQVTLEVADQVIIQPETVAGPQP